MKVRLKIGRAGDRASYNAGDVVDMPDSEAMRLIAARKAEPIEDRVVQTAMLDNRVAPRRGRRRKGA